MGLLVLLSAVVASPAAGADPKVDAIRALIVTGIDYPAHQWWKTTPVLKEELGKDPRMRVEVLDDPYRLVTVDLSRFDVLLLHFMNWEKPDPRDRAKENLRSFVERGGGLVIIHFACGAFQSWPEYAALAGRVYDRTNTHDPRGPFTVNLVNANHPLTRGMQSFETDDELYICLMGDKPIELLATARSKITNRDHPMAFVHRYGQGRVFLTPLGHDVKALRTAGTAELIRRATAWAAGREPAVTRTPSPPRQQETVLFDFERGVDFAKVATQDAVASKSAAGSSLRVVTGHKKPWPGVTLQAPAGHWDLSSYGQVALTVRNAATNELRLSCRVDNPGADGMKNCVTDSLTLSAGKIGTLKVSLRRESDSKLGGNLFGMRGYPVAPGGPGTVDPKNITQLLLFVNKPDADHVFEVDDIRATGTYSPPTASVTDAEPFFPFIDTFGQYKHRDWPGKIHSLVELTERRAAEAKELAVQSGPKDWDKFGGWAAGPQLAATGFFRVEKHRGKWWLVDPDGHLFWSHGIDCVRALDTTPIEERAGWFEDFPGDQMEFRELLSTGHALKGHYAGRSPKCFSFAGANLARKYGPDWRTAYPEVIHRRLRSWGLNTIGNWSDEATRLLHRTPYTDAVSSRGAKNIEGSDGYWGKFPDVFDASFEAGVRRSMAAKRGKSAGDPWCIGYFSDNEMSWGDEMSLGLGALKSPPEQAAKKVFLADLKTKYGEIAKLNAAWGTKHEAWDALLQSREAPDRKKAHDDLTALYTKAAEQYFRTVRDAIKAVASNQLYLGCRFAWVNDRAAIAAGKYCDVVSYNLYRRSVADFKYPGGDKPLLIGEFHFGALDRGMFHTGLVPVANQEARAEAYKDYVLSAVSHPQFVGAHWFQWKDEPTTGRVYDEENYQIGFVDVADTPYRETVEAGREVAASLYEHRLEK